MITISRGRFSAVIAARQDALAASINDHFASHGLGNLRFEFQALDPANG